MARAIEEIITLPLAIPGLAIALALLLTYNGFSDFRRSWLFILTGHVVFTLPFMVRSVMAIFSAIDVKTLDESASSLGASPLRRFLDVIVPNARPGILAGSLMVRDAVARRIQPHLDAAHAADQDTAGRACRQLRLDAARSRVRIYTGVFFHDHPAADCDADVRQLG